VQIYESVSQEKLLSKWKTGRKLSAS